MRALIAEDDAAISGVIASRLQAGGYAVDCVNSGRQANQALSSGAFDVLILDLGLPEMDGIEVLRRLRQSGNNLPVLVITARESLHDRVHVLNLGADDYLVKPFAIAEFEARVRALVRRATNQGTPQLHIGKLVLHLQDNSGAVDDQPLNLSRREFALLAVLAVRQDRIVSRQQLVEAICNWDDHLTDNGLDIAIHRLRRKLEHSGVEVRTVRGLGYLLQECPND